MNTSPERRRRLTVHEPISGFVSKSRLAYIACTLPVRRKEGTNQKGNICLSGLRSTKRTTRRTTNCTPRRTARVSAISFFLAAFAGFAGCSDAPAPSPQQTPNIVLVTIDTLRADRIEPYGNLNAKTPNLSKLAREGTLFEAAMSPMQMTRPSHYSLFTSLYPRDHGVVNNKISLEPNFLSVAQVLEQRGYATAGMVAVSLLGDQSGAARGFADYDAPTGTTVRTSEDVVGRASTWLAQRPKDKPFFLWVHLFDPHTPYAPPAAFAPAPVANEFDVLTSIDIEDLLALESKHKGNLPRDVVDRAIALYQGDIEYTDHWLGKFMMALESSAPPAQTVLAVTSDHGECFEKGIYFEHSDCLYEGAARIPLIFRYPNIVAASERRKDVVEILDVAPTLLSLAGIAVPEVFKGVDLFDESTASDRAAYLQHPFYSNVGAQNRSVRRLKRVMGAPTRDLLTSEELIGLRTQRWKYLLRASREELYDLNIDPSEKLNVTAQYPEVVKELRTTLQAWSEAHPQHHTNAEQINDELRATLEALGYLH
ncbi:MAG: choline-sulfatase [Myxococcota bacterium]